MKTIDNTKATLIIVPIILFVILVICIQAGLSVNFEAWAYNGAIEYMSPVYTTIVKFITHLGDPIFIVPVCLLLLLYHKTRIKIGLPVSITVIISGISSIILKNIFVRERPDILRLINETSYSFPSAHAMVNGALYTIIALLIFKYVKDKKVRLFSILGCILLTVLIGYSRVYLGVHYASDIIGGWLLGFVVAVIIYILDTKLHQKNKF